METLDALVLAMPFDHRLALASLVTLLASGAGTLAWAWARLLPEEQPPFRMAPANPPQPEVPPNWEPPSQQRDPFAVVLLACITLSYLLKFPGFPSARLLQWLSSHLSTDALNWTVLSARAFFVVVPGLAAAYAAFRATPLRAPLIASGLIILALWCAAPFLLAAMLN